MKILIFGASSGFGRAFALALAAKENQLILSAIDEKGLQETKEQILAKGNFDVEWIQGDLTVEIDLQRIVDKHPVIDLLINSAGKGTLGDVIHIPQSIEESDISLNVMALYRLTKTYAIKMAARGSGSIINIASTSSYQPLPNFGVYAATKAFVLSYTLSVSKEVEKYGVRVMAVCPGPTETGFISKGYYDRIRKKLFNLPVFMAPDQVVKKSLKAYEKGRRVYMPGLLNRLIYTLDKWGPLEVSLNSVYKLFNAIKEE